MRRRHRRGGQRGGDPLEGTTSLKYNVPWGRTARPRDSKTRAGCPGTPGVRLPGPGQSALRAVGPRPAPRHAERRSHKELTNPQGPRWREDGGASSPGGPRRVYRRNDGGGVERQRRRRVLSIRHGQAKPRACRGIAHPAAPLKPAHQTVPCLRIAARRDGRHCRDVPRALNYGRAARGLGRIPILPERL